MKKGTCILILSLLLASCGDSTDENQNLQLVEELQELYEIQDYFRMQRIFEEKKETLSDEYASYYAAILYTVFNKPEAANTEIEKLLGKTNALNDTLKNELYQAKLQNHINLYEYGAAAQTSEIIQLNYAQFIDSAELRNLKNEIKIWEALRQTPKQTIEREDNTRIPLTKDKVGLSNIDVAFGASTMTFLFDTGANFSAITRSAAAKLGMEVIEADFFVTAATGAEVNSDIAVASEMKIGNITLKNVVFLVFDDKDLSFPQINYYPNGAIGFPVIEAMDEICISNDQLLVPKTPAEYNFNNFALDGLIPIIACEYEDDTLRFHFDTGATSTSLYRPFFEENQEDIEAKYEKQNLSSASGGGTRKFEGYIIDKMNLCVAYSQANLENVQLHLNDISKEGDNFHGNFGQDYIKQFEDMTISFKHASVLFKYQRN